MAEPGSITRRSLLGAGAAAMASGGCGAAPARDESMGPGSYERLGVRTFINAVGTLTTFSGSLVRPEVKEAMEQASRSFVRIHELQQKVGERLAELTGAEAAFVTSGASCGLCLATCAATAGDVPERMRQLPDLTGMKDEVIIQGIHRTSYDHAFRMVGVRLVEVDTAEEMRRAISGRTAACAYVQSHHTLGGKIGLEEYTQISHGEGLPVILDAAAELPPAENLRRFVGLGVDAVAFSGGKNLRGPQCSGLLLGKRELIRKAYANSSPNNYFARIAKVGKEEIVGLLTAVEVYLALDHEAERAEWHAKLDRIARRLDGVPTVHTELIPNNDFSHSPRLSVQWDETELGVTLDQMVGHLREGEPSIEASDMRSFNPPWKGLGIFPYLLQDGEELIIAERLRGILRRRA